MAERGEPGSRQRLVLTLGVLVVALAVAWTQVPVERAGEALESTAYLRAAGGVGGEFRGEVVLAGSFVVAETNVSVAAENHDEVGTMGEPVPVADPPLRASTKIERDDWLLVARIGQATSATPAEGTYRVSLSWNEVPAGDVVFARTNASPPNGSVVAAFDIGRSLATSSVYVLKVAPVKVEPPAPPLHLKSNPARDLSWVGDDGSVDPKLTATVGKTVDVSWTNDDGIPHNLVVKDEAGKVVAGPTATVDTVGGAAKLTWTPDHAGSFVYACRFHPGMKGAIVAT